MKIMTFVAAAAISACFMATAALADTTPPAGPAQTSPAARSAKSIECSKEADAKGLHGAARKKFRAECKKAK